MEEIIKAEQKKKAEEIRLKEIEDTKIAENIRKKKEEEEVERNRL